ncbi:MAG: hypothetical protein WB680_20400 [Candidatus Acidiferrales bacterium]
MTVLHQMGHHSNNLIDLPEMSAFAGAIFSPINCTQAEAAEQIVSVRRAKKRFEIIFDPQLYIPTTNRGKLKKWPYFPRDFDTADPTSGSWWNDINKKLATACKKARVDTVCSPLVIPKAFDDKYYANIITVCNELAGLLVGSDIGVMQTVLANLVDIARDDRALEVASIVSATDADRIYLVLIGDTYPRREISDADELGGAMRLIQALERNEIPVTVGFCSSDILLWKAAGATACASGKFFNLRRFTRQRFEEPSEGGGQLPYWFEEALLSFLRQSDLLRVRKLELISKASKRNPFGQEILGQIDSANRTRAKLEPWLALSWRHYLYWFADVESRLSKPEVSAEDLMTVADENWRKLDKAKVLMEERDNDGIWIRTWLNALREFEKWRDE